MKPSHEHLGTLAETLTIPETDGMQLVQDFRHRRILSIPKEFPDTKPAKNLNQREVERVRETLQKNKGIRHKTADQLGCTMDWLDRVISHYRLDL
jgi:hypothetical protein